MSGTCPKLLVKGGCCGWRIWMISKMTMGSTAHRLFLSPPPLEQIVLVQSRFPDLEPYLDSTVRQRQEAVLCEIMRLTAIGFF